MFSKISNLVIVTLLLATTSIPVIARADDRMAGSVPVAVSENHNKNNKKNEDSKAVVSPSDTESESAPTKKQHTPEPIKIVESQGILETPAQGSLGSDLWHGSNRSLILSKLTEIPGRSTYRTMQDLAHRLLLTQSDATLLVQDQKPLAGRDLATLRLEKLLEMGDHKNAFGLYAKSLESGFYHDRFMSAGLLSAFYGENTSLACLETKNADSNLQKTDYLKNIAEICDYVLSKMTDTPVPKGAPPEMQQSDSILGSLKKDRNYRFTPKKLDEFKSLTPLDVAALVADDRFDLENLTLPSDLKNIPPHVLSFLIDELSLPENLSFHLMIQAAEQGLKTPEDLDSWYLEKADLHFGKKRTGTSLREYRKTKGWERLPYIHRAATHAEKGEEQIAVMNQAFALSDEYGTSALWPLADLILSLDPSDFSEKEAKTGFKILIETNKDIPKKWISFWLARKKNFSSLKNEEKMEYLAYEIGLNDKDETAPEDADFSAFYAHLPSREQEILKISYEKLDNIKKLHNDSVNVAYENDTDLTSSSDYVMPNAGLLDLLKEAELDQRPGEVILLSSIALRDIPPNKLQPGLYGRVIDGLIAVGLTKEAQSLAREVMLGTIEN